VADRPQDDSWRETLFVAAVVSAGALLGVTWAGAQVATLLAGNDALPAGIGDALAALVRLPNNLSDPKLAWAPESRANLPGPVLYWAATIVIVVAAVAVALLGWRIVRGRSEALDRRKRLGVPTQGRLATARDLRPLLIRRPEPGRFVLGRFGRRLIATESATQRRGRRRRSGRGAVVLIGPTRSGKTTAAIGGILDWDGPAILCSVKSDLLAATRDRRASLGAIQVFDPSGVTGQGDASWSPLRAAHTTSGAVQAARAIVEAAPRTTNVEQGEFWSQMAEGLLAGLMCVAANTDRRTFYDVVSWIVSTDMPTDDLPGEVAPILRALRADSDPVRKRAGEFGALVIEGLWRNDPRTVSSVYATARTLVWPWVDPLVAEATASSTVDLDWLLGGQNTLYICVPVKDQHRLRPVLGGLLNDLLGQALDRFVRTNEPLDPALLVVMDETATLRPDQLPSWAATVSGIGVQLVTAWQSVSQIEAAYRRDAPAILTNHLSKLFFAGISDGPGLDYISRLLGDEHVRAELTASRWPDDRGGQVATVPVVPPAALRRIHPGDALLIHGTLPAGHIGRRCKWRASSRRAWRSFRRSE
jgi:type IV secretion system protein VirD4